jgi:hypothetical protein
MIYESNTVPDELYEKHREKGLQKEGEMPPIIYVKNGHWHDSKPQGGIQYIRRDIADKVVTNAK